MRLIALLCALLTCGCASTLGLIYAGTGEWPTSSTIEDHQWLDGEPTRALKVEARFTSPLRAVCSERVHEGPARVVSDSYGLDGAARAAIGFIGVSELALGAALVLLPEPDDAGPGPAIGGTIVGLDGLATLIMAFALPDSHIHNERVDAARDYDVHACPSDVGFEVEGRVFTVQPDGTLTAADNLTLVEAVTARNAPITLRFRDSVQTTFVPPEIRCIWGYDNLRRVEDLQCPPRAVLEPALPR